LFCCIGFCFGFRISGLGFRVWCFGFRVSRFKFRVQNIGVCLDRSVPPVLLHPGHRGRRRRLLLLLLLPGLRFSVDCIWGSGLSGQGFRGYCSAIRVLGGCLRVSIVGSGFGGMGFYPVFIVWDLGRGLHSFRTGVSAFVVRVSGFCLMVHRSVFMIWGLLFCYRRCSARRCEGGGGCCYLGSGSGFRV
jgi:hypothetical protein